MRYISGMHHDNFVTLRTSSSVLKEAVLKLLYAFDLFYTVELLCCIKLLFVVEL